MTDERDTELLAYLRTEFDRLDARLDELQRLFSASAAVGYRPSELGPRCAAPFDTRAAYRRLQTGGFSPQQANTVVDLLRDLLAGKPIKWPEDKP